MAESNEDRRRIVRKSLNKMMRIMVACMVFGLGSAWIALVIIIPGGLSVAGGTVVGSGVLFMGTGAQALNEMTRFRAVRKSLWPEGYMHSVRLSLFSSYALSRAAREKYRQKYLETRRSASAMRRKLPPIEQEKLLSDMFEAITKARNWIIILGGAAILFVASIRSYMGG